MLKLVHKILEIPLAFELQQKLCQDYNDIRNEFLEYLAPEGQNILDVGCSTGTAAGVIVNMKANNYFGVDLNPGYVAMAQKRFPDGKFVAMDARKMKFDDNYFDLALFSGVLHHLPDDVVRDCFADIRRVLRRDGHMLVAEPVYSKRWLSTWFLDRDRGKFIRDEAGYESLFGGYKIIRKGHFKFSLHTFCSYVLAPLKPGS